VRIVVDLLQLYLVLIFVRIILSWFPVDPWSKAFRYIRMLDRVTDPVLVPVRRVIPPLRIGGGAIDISPMIVLIVLEIVINALR
jgi:YggT family protein